MKESGINKEDVKGIGFDATCSLAVVNCQGEPICVSSGKDKCGQPGERNIVLWADHRAEEEARLINESGSLVLDYVGGAMSVRHSLQCNYTDISLSISSRWRYPRYFGSRSTCPRRHLTNACSLTCQITASILVTESLSTLHSYHDSYILGDRLSGSLFLFSCVQVLLYPTRSYSSSPRLE
jgi:hypothetical protein